MLRPADLKLQVALFPYLRVSFLLSIAVLNCPNLPGFWHLAHLRFWLFHVSQVSFFAFFSSFPYFISSDPPNLLSIPQPLKDLAIRECPIAFLLVPTYIYTSSFLPTALSVVPFWHDHMHLQQVSMVWFCCSLLKNWGSVSFPLNLD